MGFDLDLSNVVNINLSPSQLGAGERNTSNLALFTADAYANSFGTAGYAIYKSPKQIATDFGSSSLTLSLANNVFSQKPNILAGKGSLIVIPLVVAQQTLAFSAVSANGTFKVNYGGNATAAINWNDSAATIQGKIQALIGLSQVTVTGSIASRSLVLKFYGQYGPLSLVTITNNSLVDGSSASITVTPTTTQAGETIDVAITRTVSLVSYFGVISAYLHNQTDILAAAAVIQPLLKMAFFPSGNSADVLPGGMLDLIRSNGFNQTRGLYHGDSPLAFAACYAGRALSTNFSGSNTTQTMHMKDLAGIAADTSMTQTILNECITAGADVYASFETVAKVFSTQGNTFFDRIYNRLALASALQIGGFNYLAETATKIPQTEDGMNGLKGAYRKVCNQYVANQFLAPGTWNDSTTFGVQEDFFNNIEQFGFYIYSEPIALQDQTDRESRDAPLVQIAIKEAGAVHESDVVVNINA